MKKYVMLLLIIITGCVNEKVKNEEYKEDKKEEITINVNNISETNASLEAKSLIKAGEYYYVEKLLDDGNFVYTTFVCNENICKNESDEILKINNININSGSVTIDEEGFVSLINIKINNYICNYDGKNLNCQKE